MNKIKSTHRGWWEQLKQFIKTNTSLAVIIAAALLLELTTGILFYSAQNIISKRGFQQIPQTQITLSNNVLKQNAGW